MRFIHALLTLSLLFSGALGAGQATMVSPGCDPEQMAMAQMQGHDAHHAEAADTAPDCCGDVSGCSSECHMNCAATTGLPPHAMVTKPLPRPTAAAAAPRARLPVGPPDEFLKPPRTRSL